MKDLTSNGLKNIISQAIEEIKAEQGESFSLENINLAELQRRTGVSRGKLRTLKNNHFQFITATRRLDPTVFVLYGFTDFLDNLLRQGISSATVCTRRLTEIGYLGSETTVRRYINKHKDLILAKRYIVAPQGSRGRRFVTRPGEAFQMDWGFANVLDYDGSKYKVACFAMVCHHCGQRYIEFFPNAKQESLFIGILHAFEYLGVPEYVLTDNMKSVVIRRDFAIYHIRFCIMITVKTRRPKKHMEFKILNAFLLIEKYKRRIYKSEPQNFESLVFYKTKKCKISSKTCCLFKKEKIQIINSEPEWDIYRISIFV